MTRAIALAFGAFLSRGPEDRTHFSKKGARAMAGMIVEELPRAVPELQPYPRRQSSVGGAGSPTSRRSGRGKASG
ncbi:MAG: hypothetical protein JXQ73_10270 [Phycisphaerae bacterium]|nr:hypothetical protein [Phycisphaerae bacterium]